MADTTITGTVQDAEGTLLDGYAIFTPTAIVRDGTVLQPQTPVRVDFTNGVVEATPVRSTDATWRYTVAVYAVESDGRSAVRKPVLKTTLTGVQVTGTSVALSELVAALPPIEPSNADLLQAQIDALTPVVILGPADPLPSVTVPTVIVRTTT